MQQPTSSKIVLLGFIALIAAILPLAGAYISQFGYGLTPCILCIYQRIPYWMVICLSLAVLFFGNQRRIAWVLLGLIAVMFLLDAAIASYHVGVEQGIFVMETSCAELNKMPDTIEALRQELLATPAVPCDKPQFVFLGLSMAAWNALYAWIMGSYMTYGFIKLKHSNR